MSRNIFSKAFDGLFGPGSPIPNEPTIDYENTIHSFKSNPNIESSSSYNYPREYTNYSSRDDSSYGIRLNDTNYNTKRVPSRYIYDDSDDELNKDMSQVYNQFNENSSKLSNDLKIPGAYSSYDKNANSQNTTRGFKVPDRFSIVGDTRDFTTDKFIQNRNVFKDDTLELRYNNAGKSSEKYRYSRPISLSSKWDSGSNKEKDPRTIGTRNYGQMNSLDDRTSGHYPKSMSSGYASLTPGRYTTDILSDRKGYIPKYSSPDIPRTAQFEADENFSIKSNNHPYNISKTSSDKYHHVNNRYSDLNDPTARYTNHKPRFGIYEDKKESQNQVKAKELIKLEQELNKESITKLNTKYNELSSKLKQFQNLNKLNEDIEENNSLLKQFNELIDIHNDKGINLKASNDDYDKLKTEYLNELKNHQYFYQNYIKLFDKYKAIKESRSKDLRIARMIRDNTSDANVKKLCNDIISELL